MVHAIAVEATPLTQDDIVARVRVYVEQNVVPFVAAERVIRDLCREGYQDELLALIGPSPIFELYATAGVSRDGKRRMADGGARGQQRRVERDALMKAGSLLESLVEVDGRWLRLGDLNRALCRRAAATHKRAALKVAHRARFYHAIARQIADERTSVRATFDDTALARIFEDTKP
jgi:hypothetical protein